MRNFIASLVLAALVNISSPVLAVDWVNVGESEKGDQIFVDRDINKIDNNLYKFKYKILLKNPPETLKQRDASYIVLESMLNCPDKTFKTEHVYLFNHKQESIFDKNTNDSNFKPIENNTTIDFVYSQVCH